MLTFGTALSAFPHLLPRRAIHIQRTGGGHFDPKGVNLTADVQANINFLARVAASERSRGRVA
jgi:hypothetical protein